MITQALDEQVLAQKLAEAEATIEALLAGQIDAVVDAKTRTPVLLAKAQDALRDSEERFRQLAENTTEVFYIMSADFEQTLYINPAYATVWGRSCESLYANPRSFLDAVVPEDRPIVLGNMGLVQLGQRADTIEFRIRRPDGTVRWVYAHSSGVLNGDGKVYRVAGIATDITDRRNAHQAIEESVSRFHRLTEASFDAIAISQDGIILEINAGFLRIFGYDRDDEVVGRAALEFAAEESRPEVTQRTIEGIDGHYDVIGMRRDGTRVFLEATAKSTTIRGRPARITSLRDITEKRALEDQFRQAQKMEAVGRLAGGVAHDFNNLLMIITGYSDLLLQSLMTSDPRRADVEQIRKASDAAAALTRQLLAFSRQQVIEPTVVVIEHVVSGASVMLRRLIGEDLTLITALSAEPASVYIDPSQLEQVIMNLVVNARDAMPTGGTLTIATSIVRMNEREARAHDAHPGLFSLLTVTDTGIGMTSQTRARIFEPFFTTKEFGQGTGLGLATVYGIVKQAGGYLDVHSELGQGAKFCIFLPLVDAEPATRVESVPVTPRGVETILLVEDSEGVRDIAVRVLEGQGYNVIVAPTGKAALEASRAFTGVIDLLVTDVIMPEMSGRVLAETLGEDRPTTKLLYMSGYTDDAVVRHGVMRLDTPYLQKPFSPHVLASRVREVLDAA